MDGDVPVSVVLLDSCPSFHGDENQAQIVGLEKKFGVQARRPGLMLPATCEFAGQVKRRNSGKRIDAEIVRCHVYRSPVNRQAIHLPARFNQHPVLVKWSSVSG
jgi:hypothetical protein